MKHARLLLSALALILTLSALPTFAGERAAQSAQTPSLLTWVWQAIERFVPAVDQGRAGMDPNGGDPTTPTSPSSEADNDGRGTIDPNGSDPNG
jgi:hypothetical protein